MPLKINSFSINLGIAIFLSTLVVGQCFWLFHVQQLFFVGALTDALCSYILLYGIFLFIRYSPTFYIPKYLKIGVIDLQGIVLTLAWVFFCKYLLLNIFNQMPQYVYIWNQTLVIRGFVGWILICSFIAIHFFVTEFEKYSAISEQKQTTEQLRKEAELFKLRQQLQPHFLFNSLNSINALIGKQPQDARRMVQQLSDYLRNNMRKEDHEQVSIHDELSDLQLYLSIELVRFGHRLNIENHFDVHNQERMMPPFLIQPLVENAIKFGLYGTIGTVTIKLEAFEKDNVLTFKISNPFDTTNVTPKGTGFGLSSIRRRLYLLYARNDLLHIEQSKKPFEATGIFCVRIDIPLNNFNPSNT